MSTLLSFDVRNAIRAALTAEFNTNEAREAFAATGLIERVKTVHDVCDAAGLEGITNEVAAAYVYFTAVRSGQVPADVAQAELQVPVTAGWHKANPPADLWALMGADTQPSWLDEFNKIGGIAERVEFAELADADMLAARVREAMGLSGLEGYKNAQVVDAADPTMLVFIEAVVNGVRALNPLWFVSGAASRLSDEQKRSPYDIRTAAQQAEEQRKAVLRAEARAKKVAEEHAQYAAQKTRVFAALRAANVATAGELLAQPFEDVSAAIGSGRTHPAARALATQVRQLETSIKEDLAVALAHQYLIAPLVAAQPLWFRELANGDVSLRPKPLKVKPAVLSRAQSSIRRGIYASIEKYGAAEVETAIRAIFGVGEDIVLAAPAEVPDEFKAGS